MVLLPINPNQDGCSYHELNKVNVSLVKQKIMGLKKPDSSIKQNFSKYPLMSWSKRGDKKKTTSSSN